MDAHAFIHVPVSRNKTVSMEPTECAGTIGDLDLIQDVVNNPARSKNSWETQRPIVKCSKRL